MRVIHTTETVNGKFARVYRDHEWEEYRVKFFENGIHLKDADYHTDDKNDAMDTAEFALNSNGEYFH